MKNIITTSFKMIVAGDEHVPCRAELPTTYCEILPIAAPTSFQ